MFEPRMCVKKNENALLMHGIKISKLGVVECSQKNKTVTT